MIICNNCGIDVEDSTRFCSGCGGEILSGPRSMPSAHSRQPERDERKAAATLAPARSPVAATTRLVDANTKGEKPRERYPAAQAVMITIAIMLVVLFAGATVTWLIIKGKDEPAPRGASEMAKRQFAPELGGTALALSDLPDGTDVIFTLTTEAKIGDVLISAGTAIPCKVKRDADGAIQLVTIMYFVINERTVIEPGTVIPPKLYHSLTKGASASPTTSTVVHGTLPNAAPTKSSWEAEITATLRSCIARAGTSRPGRAYELLRGDARYILLAPERRSGEGSCGPGAGVFALLDAKRSAPRDTSYI